MKKTAFTLFGILAMGSAIVFAQSGTKPTAATYITDEEVKSVNALPGVDRTIKVVDIGPENYAVGVIHRGATGARGAGGGGAPAAGGGAARGGAAAGGAGRGGAQQGEPCGEQSTAPTTGGTPGMIAHDQQTEGDLIISGSGTLVTGGKIVNGRKSAPDAPETKAPKRTTC